MFNVVSIIVFSTSFLGRVPYYCRH